MRAKTKMVYLFGHPIGHSLSPAMHNAAFSALGLNHTYRAFDVAPRDLKKAVEGMKASGFAGLNLTMPHKKAIMPMLDSVDALAKKIGAANIIQIKNGKLRGYHTDGLGALNALKKKIKLRGKKVLVLGAGGAGSAIAIALFKEGVKLTIADRSFKKAKELAKKCKAQAVSLSKLNSISPQILINASPVGMYPNHNKTPYKKKLLKKGMLVFDIVYSPLETKLLREAKSKGCKTINGLEMLLEQGFIAFEIWTGRKAPQKVMRGAVLKSLKGKR